MMINCGPGLGLMRRVPTAPMRTGEVCRSLPGAMKRDPHLETPDTEHQCACDTGGHEGPIAPLHLVQQDQPQGLPQGLRNAASTAACSNDMTVRQDSPILGRADALVDSRRARRQRSRSGDDHIMHPATLRTDRPAPATILPNFH